MSAPHLQHLAQLIANEGHVATFQSLGQYRTALLKEIAQASAAPEQEPVAPIKIEVRDGCVYLRSGPLDPGEYKLYPHAEPSEVERLRAELAESDKCVVRALNERDAGIEEWSGIAVQNGMECDRLRQQLADAQALLRRAEAYVPTSTESELVEAIASHLSTTAQPAESEIHYPGDGVNACKECPDRAELREACKRFVAGNKPAEVKS